ncbi:MAG: YlxR family protein [Desulfovibrio sp.]|nr:YlxR family protein [Desulfovibrio sp.]
MQKSEVDTTLASRGPIRMCVVCRRRFPKDSLHRYVLNAEGFLIIDVGKTRPGRGWYVCPDPVCAARFVKYRPGARSKGGKP